MSRFWVSWNEPAADGDWRPLTVPPKESVPAYWCSGWGEDYATVCAIVDALDKAEARRIVENHWRPSCWRFVEPRSSNWWPPVDRFPYP